jgi:hypothetical protein
VKLLKNRNYFSFKNHSIPKDDPVHTKGTDKELYEAIKRKVRSCHVVLILGGVYASYSKWIDKEIKIAKKNFQILSLLLLYIPGARKNVASCFRKCRRDSRVEYRFYS